MAKSKGSSSTFQSQPHWKDYLPEAPSGDEQRKEKLEERRAGWDNLINPEDGAFLPHIVTRLAVPQIWLVGGIWIIRSLPGLELFLIPLWLMPALVLGFIFWKQSGVSRGWIYPNLALIGFSLVIALATGV